MHPTYFTAEPSAMQRGFVGLVVDAETHRIILRTPLTYTDSSEAKLAARNLWLSRPAKLHAAREVA
jgi:hypothetical protein